MQSGFDAFEYAAYLAGRWRFIALCCASAMAFAIAVSLVLPKRYAAHASILIDAPAGNDPRAATAVSPVYLESLRTYERFAENDTLFLRAIQLFHLKETEGDGAADQLKRRVLKVTKPRDTKLLDIQVTLRDPVKAQAVAQFLAQETAATSREIARQTETEFIADATKTLESARARSNEVDRAILAEARQPAPESLQAQLQSDVELRSRIRRELLATEADLAGQKAANDARPFGPGAAELAARRDALNGQSSALNVEIQHLEASLGQRRSERDRLESDRRSARTAQDVAAARLNDALASLGSRGERLRVVDPGVVPERPSSPSILINVSGALLLSLVAALAYLTAAFARQSHIHSRPMRADSYSVR
jgi:capsular polysaccharide biosynthesis protein